MKTFATNTVEITVKDSAAEPVTITQDNKPPRKKSEKRQRELIKNFRLSTEEKNEFKRRCEEAGLSEADYFRAKCLEAEPLRKVKRRTPERELLVRIETALNRIGGNINQLAAKGNSAGFLTRQEVSELKTMLIEAHKIVEELLPQNS